MADQPTNQKPPIKPPLSLIRKETVKEIERKVERHLCHAKGCDVPIPPRLLMCLRHWLMVPKRIQVAIWKHYRPGQEIDKRPSVEYMKVMEAAIQAVKEQEVLNKCWKDGKRTKAYRDSLIHQTQLWMQGRSVHNTFSDECCRDFSCCVPNMATPQAERRELGMKDLMKWAE